MNRMAGKVALITGGARGQGRSHAIALAKEGADIILTDICDQIPGANYEMATQADLDETVRQVEALDRRVLAYVVDARDGEKMAEIVDSAVAELGRLDTVVINHGIGAPHEVDDRSKWYIWDNVIETNLSAVFKTASICIPYLKERGGTITMTGSASSLVAIYNNPSYTASKHALIGLAKSMAADLAPYWIRVNVICPTAVNTKLMVNEFNAQRFAPDVPNATIADMEWPATSLNQLPVAWIEPEAVSAALLYLVTDDGKYVTGVTLPVDAGMTTQPPGITPWVGQRLVHPARG